MGNQFVTMEQLEKLEAEAEKEREVNMHLMIDNVIPFCDKNNERYCECRVGDKFGCI